MGEFIFTICYGGALIIMGVVVKFAIQSTQRKETTLKTHSEKEEVI
ncbi:hypothetical protein JOC34_001444 [Virgibacillus halotolerans]|nr:hypothetical protein [Virgibacillus halotolerans]